MESTASCCYGGNVKLPSFRTLGIEKNMDEDRITYGRELGSVEVRWEKKMKEIWGGQVEMRGEERKEIEEEKEREE